MTYDAREHSPPDMARPRAAANNPGATNVSSATTPIDEHHITRLRPRDGALFVVRYTKRGKRPDALHRYFRRGFDARRFATTVADQRPVIYRAVVSWAPDGAV